jgi:pimeloyl-ACP methyl ester carboxylesterase
MRIVQEVVNFIVRPPREIYSPDMLGLAHFTLSKEEELLPCSRRDFSLPNQEGAKLQVSLYSPRPAPARCLLYLHGSSSSRLEATHYLVPILSSRYSLCSFDFAGSGLSEGDTASSGYREARDVAAVVEELVNNRGFTEVILWGRSMGAVAALIYAAQAN